jgi:hypothetical protein
MPLWSMDNWQFVQRQVVIDPNGREWTIGLMDVLGQAGDPDMPNRLLELEYAAGRYFTLIYSSAGALQWERGYPSLEEATTVYERLVAAVAGGHLNPGQKLALRRPLGGRRNA